MGAVVRFAVFIVLACASHAGCMVGEAGPAPGSDSDSDANLDAMALAHLGSYQAMSKLNVRPYTSALGEFNVNWFVAGDLASYRRIHPETSGSGATVAPGTMIVREVLDAAGKPAKLTVMAKAPAGYDPSLGDWWFAVTDIRGVPLVADGALQVGRMEACHECHNARTRDDFLFGVPTAAE